MSRRVFGFCFVGWLMALLSLGALAQSPNAERLRSIGTTLKEQNGVPVELKFNCTQLTDEDYELIASLTTLKSISIDGKPMLDRHLQILTSLTELEAIQLNGTELTDDGYRHFTAFQKLRRLSLFHPSRDVKAFTGSGLAHLKTLPNLKRLTFAGATAGDEAFRAVGQLTQLEEFSQWHNWESPDAIKLLSGLSGLKSLKMGQRLPNWNGNRPASLTDATLAEIAKISSLETIDLQEARLSFIGLSHLVSLPNLKVIKLKWVDVTETDVDRLREAMPNAKIDWEPLTDGEEETLLQKKLKL